MINTHTQERIHKFLPPARRAHRIFVQYLTGKECSNDRTMNVRWIFHKHALQAHKTHCQHSFMYYLYVCVCCVRTARVRTNPFCRITLACCCSSSSWKNTTTTTMATPNVMVYCSYAMNLSIHVNLCFIDAFGPTKKRRFTHMNECHTFGQTRWGRQSYSVRQTLCRLRSHKTYSRYSPNRTRNTRGINTAQ